MLLAYFALLQNPEDEQLFEIFYNKFYDTIFYIAKRHLTTVESAEDCAHEVLIYFAKDFHNITHDFDDKKLWNFVKIVSKCMAVSMYRKEKKHIYNVADADISEFYDIESDEFDVIDAITLKEAFDKMPEEYRYICYLKYVYNMTGEQIGKMLNMSQPLVRKRCMLGKQFVKKYFEGETE